MLLIVLVALVGIGFLVVKKEQPVGCCHQRPGRGEPTHAGPVLMGTVEQKDVPIFLDGLGTVQAFNTVTVRTRVDGQLRKLSFKDGERMSVREICWRKLIRPRSKRKLGRQKRSRHRTRRNLRMPCWLRRNGELLTNRIVAQDVYDTQKSVVAQLEAAVKADKAAVDSARVQLNLPK